MPTASWTTTLDAPGLLAHFAQSMPAAHRRYRTFVEQGLHAASPWQELQGQVLLGG